MSNQKDGIKEDKNLIKSVEKQLEHWLKKRKKEKSKIDYSKGFADEDGEMTDENID